MSHKCSSVLRVFRREDNGSVVFLSPGFLQRLWGKAEWQQSQWLLCWGSFYWLHGSHQHLFWYGRPLTVSEEWDLGAASLMFMCDPGGSDCSQGLNYCSWIWHGCACFARWEITKIPFGNEMMTPGFMLIRKHAKPNKDKKFFKTSHIPLIFASYFSFLSKHNEKIL